MTNPDGNTHVLYQADNTAIAAWANAVNAAMLAEAFRISGHTALMNQYLSAAEEAWNYASTLADQMLDDTQDLGTGPVRGRDFRMTAAAYLYNLTGDIAYEDVVNEESLAMSAPSFWRLEKIYPTDPSSWPRAELFFNTRFVWAHAEFTPQQTMRGKMALHGYLLGMTR